VSEGAADLTYLAVVLIGCASAIVKLSALRRGFSASLVVIISCHACGTCAFVTATPVVYRAIDSWSGRPGLASLVVYSFIILFCAHAHLLAVIWAAELRDSGSGRRAVGRPRVVRLLLGYALILTAMAATFLAADVTGPEYPLAFNVTHADDARIVAFLTVFMAGLAYSMLSTALECRRGARTGNVRLRKGLRDISVASLFIFGYVVFAGPSLAAAALGHHALDRLTDLGALSGTVGALILNWGFTGPVVLVWWRDRSDYRRLRVLWETTVEGSGRTVALAPPSRLVERWSLLSAGAWLLIRRLADICDAERALAPWMDPRLARAVRDAAGPLAGAEELRAMACAAMLLHAVRRRALGDPPAADGPARTDDVAPEGERPHLIRVARSLDHPLVLAAVRQHSG
jgi:hypothetical protein